MGSRRGGGRRRKTSLNRQDDDESDASSEAGAPSSIDRLNYIADMLRELKTMAAQAERPALTELLELAYREALRDRRLV